MGILKKYLLIKIIPLLYLAFTSVESHAYEAGSFLSLDDGTKIHYQEAGTGETILLIHGYASWSYTWNAVIPALATHYHVLAPDLVGFGLSDKPDLKYGFDLFANQLKEFLEKKGVARAILIGNSKGGGVAIQFVNRYPNSVTRLVLVDTAGASDEFNIYQLFLKFAFSPLMRDFPKSPDMAGMILKDILYYDASKVTQEQINMYYLPFTTEGVMNAGWKAMTAGPDVFPDEYFMNIRVPTLVLWGENDKLTPVDQSKMRLELIPDSRREVIQNCGHLPQEEQSKDFLDRVTEFLDEARPN